MSAQRGGVTKDIGTREKDCASAVREYWACSAQYCTKVSCFGDLEAVAGNDQAEMVENAVSVTEEKAEKTGVENGLEDSGDGKLNELQLGIARNV